MLEGKLEKVKEVAKEQVKRMEEAANARLQMKAEIEKVDDKEIFAVVATIMQKTHFLLKVLFPWRKTHMLEGKLEKVEGVAKEQVKREEGANARLQVKAKNRRGK